VEPRALRQALRLESILHGCVLVRSWVTGAVTVVGLGLVMVALATTQSWLDCHFLPSFFVPREWYVAIESSIRIVIAAIGLALLFARAHVARLVTRYPLHMAQAIAAAVFAIAMGAVTINWVPLRPTEWLVPDEEPRRQEDAKLGWVLAPGRIGHAIVGGRSIDYAIDDAGDRVRRLEEPVDRERSAVVFVGESVMFGEGLTWEESIPGQTGALLGTQAANLAVHGYSTDQMYLRLGHELPRFRRPVAVVAIFMAELFGRNLDDDRPHLAPGLRWLPAEHPSRAMALAALAVPYRRTATVERGIDVTREVLSATVQLARDRHADPLVVIPQFGAEDSVQQRLRARIFAGGTIPNVVVQLDPDWRLPWDRHPNAHAAQVIASAVADRLRHTRGDH